MSLLLLAEQAPAEVVGALSQLVLTGSVGQDTRFAVRNQQYAVVLNTAGLGTERNLLDR
ncbi:MAG: hypothetical protein ACLP4R_24345 [Solirubrobacteraceae bacterium]